MRFSFVLCALLFPTLFVSAQQHVIKKQANWQQVVNYTISVTLDDVNHTLSAFETIEYTNNSPDELKELYFHLWPNAYKNNETAFARQLVENGKTDFYFAEEESRGWIDSLRFTINGSPVKWELTTDIDIARIIPEKPVKPGEKIIISTPFKVKIPVVFSRLGHEDQLYCITQWYPKPAVYDVNGWNPMPYLDQGEFYSEFGRFDVSITVPDNYIVAATGNLQNEDEYQKLLALSKEHFKAGVKCNNEFPASSGSYKTLRFTQDSVHDFAWFCDKRFKVERSEVVLPKSGKKVTTWFYSSCPKSSVVHWMDTAITFYSKMVGEYPYANATGVYTPLLAGGGMEYPTITNMSSVDRQVIVHEVGHNWFYGILGTNERKYPWMDESINNYYEARSIYKNTMPLHLGVHMSKGLRTISFGGELSGFNMLQLEYQMSARRNDDQKPFLSSEAFTSTNYGTIIYGKAAIGFQQLQQYLGDDVFDRMMMAYYEKWKFKHPLPEDFMNHASSFTGKDLTWFFEGIMNSNDKIDFSIKNINLSAGLVKISRKGTNKAVPFTISSIKDGEVLRSTSFNGFTGTDTIVEVPVVAGANILRVNAMEQNVEVYRNNNTLRTSGLLKTWQKPAFRLWGNLENPYINQVFYTPAVGMNLYNKTMLGMAFYNSLLPKKKWEYLIVPMYAFGSKDLVGSAEITRSFLLSSPQIKSITTGIKAARYGMYGFYYVPDIKPSGEPYDKAVEGLLVYEKVEPFVSVRFATPNMRTDAKKEILVRYTAIKEQKLSKSILRNFDNHFSYITGTYSHINNRKLYPYSMLLNYQYGKSYSSFQKAWGEATGFINYNKPKKGLSVRVFAGVFIDAPSRTSSPTEESRPLFRAGNNTGNNDYLYDQSQFGRSEDMHSNSLFGQQLLFGDLEFKELFVSLIKSNTADKWATAANLETTLPGIIPLRIYVDVAMFSYTKVVNGVTESIEKSLLYTSGISLVLFNDVFRINFPISASQEIEDYFKGDGVINKGKPYSERISFSLNLNKINPVKAIRKASF